MKIKIRQYRQEDKEELSRIIIKCLTEVNSRDYPESIITYMVNHFTPERVHHYSLENICLVATWNGRIVGTVSLGNGVIYTTFVDPDFHGQKIGRKLIKEIEKIAFEKNVDVLKVPSSTTAEGFYYKCGYSKIDEDFNDKFGKSISMEKILKKVDEIFGILEKSAQRKSVPIEKMNTVLSKKFERKYRKTL